MALEIGTLRSAVARRVLWVVLAAATLPLLVLSALVYGTLAERLEAHLHARLHEAAKYAGLRVYERLLSAQTVLAAMSRSGADPQAAALVVPAARPVFVAIALVDPRSGAVVGPRELADTWLQLSAGHAEGPDGGKRHLWWRTVKEGQGRVLLGVHGALGWWIGEVSPDHLWGELRDADAAVGTCVADISGGRLMCQASTATNASGADRVSASWSLFTHADFGTVDWVFTRSAARTQFFLGELPLEQVAWKAAAFSLLLVAGLSLVLVRRTTVPLVRLIEGTRRLAGRDWSTRVAVSSNDEFGELAASFNDMAGRLERQMQALRVQSDIDREILSHLDLPRVLSQVVARLQVLAPGAQVGLLLASEGAGRWLRAPSGEGPAESVAVDPDLLRCVDRGWARLQGREAQAARRLLAQGESPPQGLSAPAGDPLLVFPASTNDRIRALMLLSCLGADPAEDIDTVHEIQDLCDRLAVVLVAVEREQNLQQRAVRDSLTGLLNRAGLIEALDGRLALADDRGFVLAFIDLDGFKAVNDTRGHPVGDRLLCQVADVLQALAPADALIARPGGDEFVLLLGVDWTAADDLALRICGRLSQPFVLDGQALHIGASIGLVRSPDDGHERVDLMRRADLAMYASKAAGRGRHAWYESSMDERVARRAWVLAELPHALRRNALCLHFQPRVLVGSLRLASVEALVRWPHPVHGMIPPMSFVPLAEETGLIEDLGRWVLDAACRQQRLWRDAGVAVPRVAVNVSALQLAKADFADELLALLRHHGLAPSDLEIEITESLFVGQADEVSMRLEPLRAAGVKVALDDFGTGFSSLSSLHRLPVDVLKIDRSFVIDLGQRDSADAVARSIVALARALGKLVVAEGVETEAQHRHLVALGCDELQGFRFGRPMAPEALLEWLQAEAQLA